MQFNGLWFLIDKGYAEIMNSSFQPLLKIKKSDYSESQKLIKIFKKICKELCTKEDELNKKFANLQTR